jgi:hypothetical protein
MARDGAAELARRAAEEAEGMATLRGRALEEMSTADARVGGLGPALFAVIILGIAVLLLCVLSRFIDRPKQRRTLQITACWLLLVPLVFFTSVPYVKDTSELVSNRRVDNTYVERVYLTVFFCFSLLCGCCSLIRGDTSPLLMHRQGRHIGSTSGTKV